MNDDFILKRADEYIKNPRETKDLMDVIEKLQKSIRDITEPKDFGEKYILGVLLEKIIFNSVEDKYIPAKSFENLSKTIGYAIKDIMNKKEKLPRPILDLLRVYKEEVIDKQLPVRKEIEIAIDKENTILCDIANADDGEFRVSSFSFPYIINMDKNLSNPKRCKAILNAFLNKIEEIDEKEKIDKLCFVEKVKGPIGALPLLPSLVEKTGKEACIYRPRIDHETKFTGSVPKPGERICIIYDLIVSGEGIINTANSIKESVMKEYQTENVYPDYSVVLADLRETPSKLERNGVQMEISSIIHYPRSRFKKDLISSLQKEYEDIEKRASKEPFGIDIYIKGVEKLIDEYGILEAIE